MSVRQTSREAYESIAPELGKRQREVLRILLDGDCTNREISNRLGLEICSITGRTKELRELGFVMERGFKVDPVSRKRVTVWGIALDRQLSFFGPGTQQPPGPRTPENELGGKV